MIETSVFIKYDGDSDSLQNHRIDARQLANALLELSNLISDGDKIVNGVDSQIEVMAQAGFHQGSFGLELIVTHALSSLNTLQYLGLVAAPFTGSLFNILKAKGLGEIKDDEIVIDQTDNTTTVILNGVPVETRPEVIELLANKVIRSSANKVVHKPLESPGVDIFKVVSSFDDDAEEIVAVDKESSESFTLLKPSKSETLDELESVATIEFITSNKESGTSGWKMRHLGNDVSVKITDDFFLELITKENSPSIYGKKYRVDLHYKKNKSATGEREYYTITKVH